MQDYFTQQTRAKLLQLPTPDYAQAEQRTLDTLARILGTLSSDVKEFEMLHGWCQVQASRLTHEANAAKMIDVITRNQLLGAAQAYGVVAQMLNHRIANMGNHIEELRTVCEL